MDEKNDSNNILNLSAASTPQFDLNEFMREIENELRKKNCSLTQVKPKNEIKQLLAQINSPGYFNSTLFEEIINQVPITTHPDQYSLDAFFQEYVKYYLELRRTRELIVRNSDKLKQELTNYKRKLASSKDSSNMKDVKLKVNLITNSSISTERYDTIKFKITHSLLKENLNFYGKNECTFTFSSYNEISNGLTVIASKSGGGNEAKLPPLIIDEINQDIIKKYELDDIVFELKAHLEGGLFDFYSTRIFNLENKIMNDESVLPVLNSNINQLERIFGKTPLIENYYNNNKNYGHTPFDQIIGYADDIEHYIKGATGQDSIEWDSVLYWLDVSMMVLLFVQFLRRYDMIALLIGFGIFGMLYDIVKIKYGLYMLVCLIVNLIFEIVWLFYYMTKWGVNIPHEQATGRSLRKWVIVLGWILFLVEVAMIFVLWKYISEKKYSKLKKGKVSFKDYETFLSRMKPSIERQSKPNRFSVTYKNPANGTYDLRNNEEIDEP